MSDSSFAWATKISLHTSLKNSDLSDSKPRISPPQLIRSAKPGLEPESFWRFTPKTELAKYSPSQEPLPTSLRKWEESAEREIERKSSCQQEAETFRSISCSRLPELPRQKESLNPSSSRVPSSKFSEPACLLDAQLMERILRLSETKSTRENLSAISDKYYKHIIFLFIFLRILEWKRLS